MRTKYFGTVIKRPAVKPRRQAAFLDALRSLSDFDISYGHWLSNPVTRRKCGHTYEAYREKMPDVNNGIGLMRDAFEDNLDAALIVSGDSDLVVVVKPDGFMLTRLRAWL